MPRGKPRDPVMSLNENYIPEPNSGCWLWLGPYTAGGYGLVRLGVRAPVPRAHRLSLQVATGQSGDGLMACHHCDVPSCVNPSHLFWGTAGDNKRDSSAKGRASNKINAAKTACPRGHPYSPENTYINTRGARVCRTCAAAIKIAWAAEHPRDRKKRAEEPEAELPEVEIEGERNVMAG